MEVQLKRIGFFGTAHALHTVPMLDPHASHFGTRIRLNGLHGSIMLYLYILWASAANADQLQVVGSFPDQQVTGIGVSMQSGRVFVNFPYWTTRHPFSVAELKADGSLDPYPNSEWNSDKGDPENRFVCVQSVVVDQQDHLWVLDAGSPQQKGVIPGAAKVVEIDLANKGIIRIYPISDAVAPKKSYLNDIRVDIPNRAAYISESGIGSIIVLNLDSGKARALLRDEDCTKAEKNVDILIDGVRPIDSKTGTTPMGNVDGIALDARGVLYFHSLTAHTLYQVATADLLNESLSEKQLASKITSVAKTAMPDGILACPDGTLLMTDIEHNAVNRFYPATNLTQTIVKDDRLQWPDSMARGPNGQIYVTTSQVFLMPDKNAGVNKQKGPFLVFRFGVGNKDDVQ